MDMQSIFKEAVEKRASDIHLIVARRPVIRVDGQLFELSTFPIISNESIVDYLQTLFTQEECEQFKKEKEIGSIFELHDGNRFRVNAYSERGNPGIVARIIPCRIPSFEAIGLPNIAHTLTSLRQGLVLITGKKGVGKSTTLAVMIDHINTYRAENIITFEDPIEYCIQSKKSLIKQRQLGGDFRSFSKSLKYVPRHDPDIIVVGEMRDLETMAAVLTLAETGHLVLSTLHTCNASQTVNRIIDTFPSHQQTQIRLQLSLILRGIISQQLLPRIGGGRVAAREILINTPAVSHCIREGKIEQIPSLLQTGAQDGMMIMDRSLTELHQKGFISQQDMYEYMMDEVNG